MGNAILLSLAWFAVVNAALSVIAWLAAGRLSARPAARGRAVLALRLLPSGGSLLFVIGVFSPAHWRFEPRGAEEVFGAPVYALALCAAWMLARAIARALQVARASYGLRFCERLPRLVIANGPSAPVYEVGGFAGVSLAGILRPRVLVGPDVRHALTAAELEAAVSHELAHHAAGDNLKRAAMFCAPDFFRATAAARGLESRWRAAAEWQADGRAVAGDASRAVALASALVKVARLGSGAGPALHSPVWSTLHEAPLLERRVRRLLSLETSGFHRGAACGTGFAIPALAALAVVAGVRYAEHVHRVTETLAHLFS